MQSNFKWRKIKQEKTERSEKMTQDKLKKNQIELERILEEAKVEKAYEEAFAEYRQTLKEKQKLAKTVGKIIGRER